MEVGVRVPEGKLKLYISEATTDLGQDNVEVNVDNVIEYVLNNKFIPAKQYDELVELIEKRLES